MRPLILATLATAALAGCGVKNDSQAAADSTARSIELPKADSTVALNDRPAAGATGRVDTVYVEKGKKPGTVATPRPAPPPAASTPGAATAAPAPAPAPAPAAPAAAKLDAGTVVVANAVREVSSRRDKAGDTFTAKVAENMTSADGRTVIPAGSEITFTIAAIKSTTNASPKEASITLRATSVSINGVSHPIDADVGPVEHTLKGRGVTGKEVAKTGVGAAAGAIVGKVVGGGTGAAVGAVTGAAAGAAVAAETATKDIVVPVGAKIKLTLKSVFAAGA